MIFHKLDRRLVLQPTLIATATANHFLSHVLAARRGITLASRAIHLTSHQAWNPFHRWGSEKGKREAPDKKSYEQLTGSQVDRDKLMQDLTGNSGGIDSSIFGEDLAQIDMKFGQTSRRISALETGNENYGSKLPQSSAGASLIAEHLARAINPNPVGRMAWQRKTITRRIVQAGTNPFSTESRNLYIARTERQITVKSPFLPTSVKKLGPLARQITGKRIDEAILQMQYSKKKVARYVLDQLKVARDRAVVERGMGLGEHNGEKTHLVGRSIKIQTKGGKHRLIEEPTKMYISQAWVGRGTPRGYEIMYRAKGRANRIVKPATSISVLLKEEKTLVREHFERLNRQEKRGPWLHLPDRPISAQRPYYSW